MNAKFSRFFFCFLFFVLFVSGVSCSVSNRQLMELGYQSERAGGSILIRNVDVFVGKSPELLRAQDVLIQGERIQKVAESGTLPYEADFHVIQGEGKTLLPGFVDTHVHLSFSGSAPWKFYRGDAKHNLEAYLYAGVTTVYDLGGEAPSLKRIKNRLQKEKLIGPQIFHTHALITAPESHPLPLIKELLPWPIHSILAARTPVIREPSQAPQIIESQINREVDFIKIVLDELPPGSHEMDEASLRALIRESHQRGKKVFVHIGTAENALMAARAGADVLAHGIYRGSLTEKQAKEIASSGVQLIYTLAGWQNVSAIYEGSYEPDPLAREITSPRILDPVTGEAGKRLGSTPGVGEMALAVHEYREEIPRYVKMLYEAGVPFLVGTDSPLAGVYPGSSFHEEMERLHQAGIPAPDVLIAATWRGASLLTTSPDFGSVEEGKIADLVLVRGNPLEDIRAAREIEKVWRGGKTLKRIPPRKE
jgi:imidazolonepropionase-like amidohydrolase